MSFKLLRTEGQHNIFTYNIEKYPFCHFIEKIYGCSLDQIHTISKDYQDWVQDKSEYTSLQDVESDLHKRFYSYIKQHSDFKELYVSFIRDLYQTFYPDEPFLLYQSYPSIRFQYPGNRAVPPHCDSDSIGRHPIGEKNALISLTKMYDTTSLFIERFPGGGEEETVGIKLEPNELLLFNGNKCIHYNKINSEGYIRISFDFRMILPTHYINYILNQNITYTNPRDPDKKRVSVPMLIGGYYQLMTKDKSVDQCLSWYTPDSLRGIVQSRPQFEIEEKNAVIAYMNEPDPFITEFKHTSAFENAFVNNLSVLEPDKWSAFAVPNGTMALMLALLACDIKAGDDVIVPDHTMVATANAVRAIGARPILIDVRSDTWTVDPQDILNALTPNTKAVIHVSLNNRAYNLEELVDICKSKNLMLIEDAAQSVGAMYKGRSFGTWGDIGCFSFSTPKIISTGQGGMVITSNPNLKQKINYIKNFGRAPGRAETYESFGLNFKFTDLQAVIGLAQLAKVPERRMFLRHIYDLYYTKLGDSFMLPPLSNEWFPWFITILTPYRNELQQFLEKHGIQTRVAYPALHRIPTGNNHINGEYIHSTQIEKQGLFLPTHLQLLDRDIDFITDLILLFHSKHSKYE